MRASSDCSEMVCWFPARPRDPAVPRSPRGDCHALGGSPHPAHPSPPFPARHPYLGPSGGLSKGLGMGHGALTPDTTFILVPTPVRRFQPDARSCCPLRSTGPPAFLLVPCGCMETERRSSGLCCCADTREGQRCLWEGRQRLPGPLIFQFVFRCAAA